MLSKSYMKSKTPAHSAFLSAYLETFVAISLVPAASCSEGLSVQSDKACEESVFGTVE